MAVPSCTKSRSIWIGVPTPRVRPLSLITCAAVSGFRSPSGVTHAVTPRRVTGRRPLNSSTLR